MNKDYTNKDALKQSSNKDPQRSGSDPSKPIASDKSKAPVSPSSSQNQQSKNR